MVKSELVVNYHTTRRNTPLIHSHELMSGGLIVEVGFVYLFLSFFFLYLFFSKSRKVKKLGGINTLVNKGNKVLTMEEKLRTLVRGGKSHWEDSCIP